jgi:glutathione S-transferase
LSGPLGVLEGALRARQRLLEAPFTVADLNVSAVLGWASLAGVDLQPWPGAAAWMQRCADRPAYKRARS